MSEAHAETERSAQMLAAARSLIAERRSLNLTLNDIAEEVGVSRSLVYVYFESVGQIVDELFRHEAEQLSLCLDRIFAQQQDFRGRTLGVFRFYLDQLVDSGPIGNIVLRERNQDSPLGKESSALFRSILRRLSADAARHLALSPREAFVFYELTTAIPESLARLVRRGKLVKETADATCDRLVGAAIDAMAVRSQ